MIICRENMVYVKKGRTIRNGRNDDTKDGQKSESKW